VSFGIYLFGIVLVIAGLVYAASMLSVPTPWLVVCALIMLGAGIVTAVKATRQRDPVR
jgi:membrane-bound acyltransferase YfiQ involved in biofilm formation